METSENFGDLPHDPELIDDPSHSQDELGDMTFHMSNYAKEALKMMFMMRSHHMLTDVKLEIEKETFYAHKVVLSAASPYFKAMFTSGLKERDMERIRLQGVCPTAMARILFFMYTGHIRVTEITVCQILPAATMLQVTNVIDACCAFLERQLDPSNAIGIANFAEQHGCKILKEKAEQFIEHNFTKICHEEEFLQLSVMQLVTLIKNDALNVQGEREVYDAVLKWIRYDGENRFSTMQHILQAVRCQLLTPSFLQEQMSTCDLLRRVPACREYLAQVFQDLTLHKRLSVNERKPNTTRMIFVAGGYFRHSLDMLESYNVDDNTWITLPHLTVPRSGLGAAFLKGSFYAVGGRNNSPGSSYDSDWVDRYNPETEAWRPCSPMSVPRNRLGVAVMDELLYAVGGSAGSVYHSSVERYDPQQDQWSPVPSMNSKRLGVGVAVVNRLLYAIGGFNGTDRLATVECYHPENNAWTPVPSMQYGRSGAGVAALGQYIYVVGGFNETGQLESVERYDTENRTWDMVAPISIARSALSVTVLDDKLYATGGYDGQNFLAIVEVYDPISNTWQESNSLTSGRSGHASAVIYAPPSLPSLMENFNIVSDSKRRKNERGNDGSSGSGSNQGVQAMECLPSTSRGAPSGNEGAREHAYNSSMTIEESPNSSYEDSELLKSHCEYTPCNCPYLPGIFYNTAPLDESNIRPLFSAMREPPPLEPLEPQNLRQNVHGANGLARNGHSGRVINYTGARTITTQCFREHPAVAKRKAPFGAKLESHALLRLKKQINCFVTSIVSPSSSGECSRSNKAPPSSRGDNKSPDDSMHTPYESDSSSTS